MRTKIQSFTERQAELEAWRSQQAILNGGAGSGPKYGIKTSGSKTPAGSKIQQGSKIKSAPAAKPSASYKKTGAAGKSTKRSGGMKFGKHQSPREVITPF